MRRRTYHKKRTYKRRRGGGWLDTLKSHAVTMAAPHVANLANRAKEHLINKAVNSKFGSMLSGLSGSGLRRRRHRC